MNRTIACTASAAIAALALTGCATAGHPAHHAAVSAAPAATTAPAPPSPSPDGTFSGSCDYTLSPGIYGNDHLVGEIDLKNTGNIGTIVKTRITWPQEGYPPITERKTVRLPAGASKTVRFVYSTPTQGNVISLLQSWQERHGMRDGCTYYGAIAGTYGSPS